jgi:hypothetical protein
LYAKGDIDFYQLKERLMPLKYKFSAILILLNLCLFSGCESQIPKNVVQTPTQEETSTVVEHIDEVEPKSNNDEVEPKSDNDEVEPKLDKDVSIESLYDNLYIGEVFESGYAYIEPFKYDRFPFYEPVDFQDYSDSISFYSIGSSNNYKLMFDSESNSYIPSKEESQYFWQASEGESDQYTLCYQTEDEVKEPSIGITFMNYEITNVDYTNQGDERIYSDEEYNDAVADLEKSNEERSELDGTLSERTLEDSIVGAKQICRIRLEDSNYEILLSKYFYLGFESTADVYVIDFLDAEGNVIQTMEKSNGVAY